MVRPGWRSVDRDQDHRWTHGRPQCEKNRPSADFGQKPNSSLAAILTQPPAPLSGLIVGGRSICIIVVKDEKARQQVSEAIAAHDAMRPNWRAEREERLAREARQAEERMQRARESQRQVERQLAADNSKAWCDWVDRRVVGHLEQYSEVLYDALGEVVAKERNDRDRLIKAAVEEARRAVDAKLEVFERRMLRQLDEHNKQCDRDIIETTDRTQKLSEAIAAEREARREEIGDAVGEAEGRLGATF